MNTGGGIIKKKFVYLKSGSAKSPKTKYEYGGGIIKLVKLRGPQHGLLM